MQSRTLYNGERIPVLGLGTWRMGGSIYPDYSQDKEMVKLIQEAIELGYTHIDTAEIYGGGHTEELVGRAIQHYAREGLFITTKIWHTHLAYRDVIKSVEASLKRLQTEYIDLCLVHWPSTEVPFSETFEALNELVAQGMIHHLGVSNFDLEGLKLVQSLSPTPIITNQVAYNLYHRACVKNGVLRYCQENDLLLSAYSPFERGVVLHDPLVAQIASKYGMTPAQIAINWLVRQPNVIAIPMSASLEHLKSNLAALEKALDSQDVLLLNALELPEESLWPE